MDRNFGSLLRVVFLCLLLLGPLSSEATQESDHGNSGTKATQERLQEKSSRSTHSIVMGDKKLSYSAVAGQLPITQAENGSQGVVFYIAYEAEGLPKPDRPITFAFNGGPGAASVWLHLGGLGPKRIELSSNGTPLSPPVRYSENPYTWLAFTDLVFVDPIGTGYSRSSTDDENTSRVFWGVRQDIQAIAEFIRLYLTRNARWISPKYLIGESYGTTRVAGLTWHLHQRYGIHLTGVVLISPVLDFNTILFHPSNDLPYLLFLPTYAASAWYHQRLSETIQKQPLDDLLRAVEEFCLQSYTVFLAKGDNLADPEKRILSSKLSDFTGLSDNFIANRHFRISWIDFTRYLFDNPRILVGRMDSTVVGFELEYSDRRPHYDPALDPLYGPFSSALNHYVRNELQFETDRNYEFLNSEVNRKWDWRSGLVQERGFVDVSPTLRDAMAVNEHLRVFVAAGLYDLATPYFATQYTVSHMWLEDQTDNMTVKFYRAGHMIYTHTDACKALYRDIKDFYQVEHRGTRLSEIP